MLDLFVDKKVLNITVRKATDPSPPDVNMDHIMLEEQIPIDHVGEPVVSEFHKKVCCTLPLMLVCHL